MSIEHLQQALDLRPTSPAPQLPASVALGAALPMAVFAVVLIGMDLHWLGVSVWTAAIVLIAFALNWVAACVVVGALALSGILFGRFLLGGAALLDNTEQTALALVTLLALAVGQLVIRGLRQRDAAGVDKYQIDVLGNTAEAIFAASHDCIKLLAVEGSVLAINPRGLTLIGADRADQMIGQNWFSFWDGEQQKCLGAAWHTVLTSGYAEFEGSCRIFTGERRRWRNTFTLVHTPVQSQVYVLCISSDITESASQQQAIKSNAERLNGLLSNIDDASFALDSDWTISFANPRAEQLSAQMTQTSPVAGHSFWDIFPIVQGESAALVIHRAMEAKTTERCEYFCTARQLWLSMTLFPCANGLNVLARDITSVKKIQQLADEEHARLQTAHDIAGFGDWSFDYDAGEIQLSPDAVMMLELENCPKHEQKQRLLGKLNSRDRMALVQAIVNCTEATPRIDLVVHMPSQNGTVKRVRWIGRLLTDVRGNAERLVGAIQVVGAPAEVRSVERAHEVLCTAGDRSHCH